MTAFRPALVLAAALALASAATAEPAPKVWKPAVTTTATESKVPESQGLESKPAEPAAAPVAIVPAAAKPAVPEPDTKAAEPAAAAAEPAPVVAPAPQDAAAPAAPEPVNPTEAEAPAEAVKAAAAAPPAPVEPTLQVSINLTSQRMTVTENGAVKYTWPVSSGAYGYATPTGQFRPIWMSKMWYSRKYDMAPMPHSIFFDGGHAIHATYSVGMLGQPASHGCVRLSPSNAARLYKMVSAHGKDRTRIAVHGKAKYSAPRIARSRPPQMPRYATVSRPQGYSPYAYNPYGTGARFVYPGDQRYYYANAQRRRAQMLKQRRYVMRQYYSGY
jgi:lipoprotein-anchoring transpeptidase ErfK/SrfK